MAATSATTNTPHRQQRRRNAVIFAAFPPQAQIQRTKSAMKKGIESLDDSLHTMYRSISKGKTVRFGVVSVSFYSPVLGDNPSAPRGPSLTIGWKPYSSANAVPVDRFEEHRPEILRHHLQLVIPPDERHRRLEDAGYTPKQIIAAVRETNKARDQRKKTMQGVFRQKEEEMIDSIRQSTKSFVRRPWQMLRNIDEEAELDELWTRANTSNIDNGNKTSKKHSSWKRKVAKAA